LTTLFGGLESLECSKSTPLLHFLDKCSVCI
jgi:hypothetical protein